MSPPDKQNTALAGDYLVIKHALIGELGALAQIADQVGMASLSTDLNGTRIPKLDEERFALVVLGEFNHGKSTFVNALCGAAILPAGITPTTATINHLVYSDEPRATAYLSDGTSETIDPKKLGEWVTIEGARVEQVRYVEIGWPAPILADKLTLVDTPGVNDINEQRAEITYGYIPRADAVLFLLDGAQVLKQSERSFLEQRILRRSKNKLVFVLGKIDLLTADEQQEALDYCRTHLAAVVEEPVLFALSAKRSLSENPEEKLRSGMPQLINYLQRYLVEQRGQVLLDNGISDAQRTAGYLRQNLGIKRRSLDLALDELEARIARVKLTLEDTKRHLRAHHGKIRAEADAVKAGVRLDLEQFTKQFLERLPAEIDRADADSLKKYLQAFIQDAWKSWAEQEGEKIAAQLERLAEEIIQVTNENLDEAMKLVARELGPADTKIDIQIDTLKYDVGVFALGALGTGIFLFVNSLVGGLLTLAAPILAVLIKGRVAGELKAQAKRGLPEVVNQAAAAVGPRFGQIIDDFAARLSDFVTAAGDALHRGIQEVLDQALTERRAQGVDTAARAAEVDGQLAVLGTIDERLAALTDRLWAFSTGSTDSPTNSAT